MLVKDVIAKLKKLPQDAEFVAFNDEREIYVGMDEPEAITLKENRHGELVDSGIGGRVHVAVTLQG